ncbi:MAG TPA: phage tail assembly protein [Novosphingobium sp.]|nr:phage tail assembly protein [Novosphingobium sp.]
MADATEQAASGEDILAAIADQLAAFGRRVAECDLSENEANALAALLPLVDALKKRLDPPEALEIPLAKPVELGSESYPLLRLREPTAGEMIELDKFTGWEADVKAIALISGVPEAAVRKLGVRPVRRASEYLGRFLR